MKKRLTAAVLACSMIGLPSAWAALPNGASAPEFKTQAAQGGDTFQFDLNDALRKGPLVLYFFPAAFTKGCTIEAHDFAEAVPEYEKLGARVIGISADSIDVLKPFSVSECQSKFPVAADGDGKIMRAYDAVHDRNAERAQRISYVITPDRKVIYSYADSDPDKHVANTLEALRTWRAQHPDKG